MLDPAIALDASVPAPAIILQLLNKLGVPAQVVADSAALHSSRRLQAVLLEDAIGAMLVLFSADQLLDLHALAELTGRQLLAIKPERLQRMLDKHQLGCLPGLPPLTRSPCLYDERLLQHDSLLVESGQPGVLLKITSAAYQRLLGNASAARFAVPLASIAVNLQRPDDDRAEISRAVESFTARRIQQRLQESIEVPPLPATAQKIIKLRVDPDATVDDITGVVQTDPALAAQVVSWAASAYYAAPGKIRSVEHAIVRSLGFDLVTNLALGLALGKTLQLPKDQPQHATPYWQQAIYSAAVIEGLTCAIPQAQRPEAGLSYLGGLLHNFGYLLLAQVFPAHFSLICRHIEVNRHLNHGYIEQHLLGITREQIGSWLMRHWDMPEELASALRFQNDPDYAGPHALYANLLCLALHLLASRGIGSEPLGDLPPHLLQRLGISRKKAEEVIDTVLQADAALRAMTIPFNPPD